MLNKLRNDPNWEERQEPRPGSVWILFDDVVNSKGQVTGRVDHAGIVYTTYMKDGHLKYKMIHAKGEYDGVIIDEKEYDWPSERKNYKGKLKFFNYKSEVIF